ncbi:THO complex subunit 3, partial [Haplosporangium bisporale]
TIAGFPSLKTREYKAHKASVHTVGWNSDGRRLASGSVDKTARIWTPERTEDVISIIDTRTFQIAKKTQFRVEVNEIGWNPQGNLFFLTTGQGHIKVLEYPSMNEIHTMEAHTSNCYCLEFDPRGRYLATGSADALVNLWDMEEFHNVRSFGVLDWPIRTISFSFDGQFLVSASEDLSIDISLVETGESVHKIDCFAAMNTVAWHPSKYLLAYAGDETDMVPGRGSVMAGNLRIFGFSP